MYEGIHKTIMFVLNTLIEHKLAKKNIDLVVEAYKLNALIDGLAMHLITQPQKLSQEMAEHIISTHLQSLCKVKGAES
ncbi:hypothetical protein D3C75_1147830 [compost metagenome]